MADDSTKTKIKQNQIKSIRSHSPKSSKKSSIKTRPKPEPDDFYIDWTYGSSQGKTKKNIAKNNG